MRIDESAERAQRPEYHGSCGACKVCDERLRDEDASVAQARAQVCLSMLIVRHSCCSAGSSISPSKIARCSNKIVLLIYLLICRAINSHGKFARAG